jgi:hypothetical protein
VKKIPALFTRIYKNHKIVGITDEITPGCEEAFKNGVATIKIDGSCCVIIDGKFYRRYDAKKGKKPPVNAIPCCDPDPITGHWPHWIRVDEDNLGNKWFYDALINSEVLNYGPLENGTYEAVGPHFQGNPYNLSNDILVKHGTWLIAVKRDFESIKSWLNEHHEEGIVFWLDGEPVCKIKRTDFGFEWPAKEK